MTTPEYLYCDNFATCKGKYPLQRAMDESEARAQARGWHVFHGHSNGGAPMHHVLCPDCVGPRSHRRPPVKVLDGQEALF